MSRLRSLRILLFEVSVVLLVLGLGGVAAGSDETENLEGLGLPLASPESVGMSAERLERLTAAMQGYVDRREVAGVVTLVARRGKVVHLESLGHRHVEGDAPMTPDTIFRLASMTKPIASAALMMLWEEGRFQLRDPISKFLPAYAEMDVAIAAGDERVGTPYKRIPAARPITVQHLLTHTAGLPNLYRGMTRDAYLSTVRARRNDPDDTWTLETMSETLAMMPLNFHPGDQWEYGPATDIVGRLVEVISGQSFDAFLKERIFQPLDMTDTHFYLPADKVGRFAALYGPDDAGKIELTEAPTVESRYIKEPHAYFSGAGGLVGTARDYFRFHQMMLNGGELDGVRLLGPKTVELMTTNHIGELETWLRGPGYGFGLGYSVVTDKGLSGMPAQLGSYAWGGAFGTVFWVDPEEELLGIMMTQIRPYTHVNIRQDVQTLTYQAIVE